jgi:Asp/Glu/hydantoin racemase
MPARGWSDPMRLHIVNPNTTEAMTAKIAAAAGAVALPDTVIDARQPEMGPVSIEGFYDEAFAVPGMLGCIREPTAMARMRISSPASTTQASMRLARSPARR